MAYQASALRADQNGVPSSPQQQPTATTTPTAAATVAAALRQVLARNTRLYWREFRIAPLWKRFVAEAIDLLILFLLKLAITFIAVDWFELLDIDS